MFRVITIKILVPEDECDEVTHGHIQLACHDASLGAYATDAEPTDDDREVWADIIEDAELEHAYELAPEL